VGVWGTAIFSDDNASDVRDDYRRMVGDGLSGPEATDRLLGTWMSSMANGAGLAATFWLALAVTQWNCGRLEDRVRNEALRSIEDGSALAPWRGSKLERKRAAVLEATKRQLESPQPPARKIAKQFRSSCEWEPGELVAYRMPSGAFIVFHVVEHHHDAGGVAPVCEIFDWQGSEIPQPSELENLPMRAQIPIVLKNQPEKPLPPPIATRPQYRLMMGQVSKREFPKDRLFRLNAKLPIRRPPVPRGFPNPTLMTLWRSLDRQLELSYGLR
jgi:hypothetical protein